MRKLLILMTLFGSALFSSCQQDIDIWDSATLEYAGRYVIRVTNEEGTSVEHEYDGAEFRIYNTANNVANEIWIEDNSHILPLKSKFFLSGNATAFQSTQTAFDQLTDNLFTIVTPPFNSSENSVAAPTAADQSLSLPRPYLRAALLEGKIIQDAVTTKGGNIADSLYLKIKLYSGSANFTSVEKAKAEWKDPNVAEYKWVFKSVTHDPSKDKTLIIGGYSYTGFPEDMY